MIKYGCLLSLLFFVAQGAAQQMKPNFILVIADDISFDDLGCYGNMVVKTPHLDAMALEGLVFHNAYLTASSCSPSRTSLITGRYPHNTGACELHTPLPPRIPTFPEALRASGYYTALSGKHHMGKAANSGFDQVSLPDADQIYDDWISILQERPRDRPFFLWLASYDAHRPWGHVPDVVQYDPADVIVPPFMVDGPRTRQELAHYYHEISSVDRALGRIRKLLQDESIDQHTYVIFMSDNGRPFPRSKTRLYDSGIKTPFIVTRPGHIQPGVTESLISSIDIAPTILSLAGLTIGETIQGVSFRKVLSEPHTEVRDYIFAEQNWHVYQAHQRMVRWKDWMLIRNAFPNLQALSTEADPTFEAGAELWEAEAQGMLRPEQRDVFLVPRPQLELYHVRRDPHQLRNLATDHRYRKVVETMTVLLDRWAEETGDTVPEHPTNDRADIWGTPREGHRRGEMPGSSRNATAINHKGPVKQ